LVEELEKLLLLGRIPSPPWICFYASGLEYVLEEARKLEREELRNFYKKIKELRELPHDFIYEIEKELT